MLTWDYCMSNWTLFSNHGHVLICLARNPQARLRDVAADVGITERAVQKIVRDLQDGGMVSVTKSGRRNQYRIHKKQSFRHDLVAHCDLNDLIRIVKKEPGKSTVTALPTKDLSTRSVEPKVVEPKVVEPKVVEIEREKSGPGKAKTGEPKQEESKDRQQGSLF